MNALDKEEFRIKLEEINKLVQDKDYKGAMNIVDSIDWRRVKNVRTLCVVGEIYAANGRFEDSKEIFLLAYHKASIGKNILYRLIEISLRMDDINEAEEFFEEYKQVASNDSTQYILQYKIARAKNSSLNEQIRILEEYKEQEFTEKWSYELAALYYKAGEKQKSLDLCNEIILWFSEGKYVMKAYDLKMRMGELTGAEKAKFEKQFVPKLLTPEQAKELKKAEKEAESEKDASEEEEQKVASDSEVADVSEDTEEKESETPEESEPEIRVNMEGIQEQISKGIRDIFGGKTQEEKEEFTEESDDMINEAGITKENEIPEEIIKSDASQEEPENVPQLEAEPEKPGEAPVAVPVESVQEEKKEPDFSATIKMPELNIPASMKNMELSKAPKVEDVAETKLSMDSFKTSGTEFNLEDTILAAASAQGIEIPKEETQPEVKEPEKISETEPEVAIKTQKIADELEEPDFLSGNLEDTDTEDVKAEPAEAIIDEEKTEEPVAVPKEFIEDDEDEVTEEDLRRAEEEFLYGPAGNSDVNLEDIDDTEPEQLVDVAKEEEEQPEPLTEEEELERFIESIQPKDETDPRDIVPREKELTDDEKQLFTYFVKIPGMKEQVKEALDIAQKSACEKTSKAGNMIVTGRSGSGKTRFSESLIKALCKERQMEGAKVAYLTAEVLNKKDPAFIVDKLSGGFLAIGRASAMTAQTVENLSKAMEFKTNRLTVILEDSKAGIYTLKQDYPEFMEKFDSRIVIPVFTNDELVSFAKTYAKEKGYKVDDIAVLAVYSLIGDNQYEDDPVCVGQVREMMDSAIAKASRLGRRPGKKVAKRHLDVTGRIMLYEKDFNL